tara:strand:- start:206 stop:832 length:627 start_codon:yes stop_codon:yes gene_type:complete
MAKQPKRFVADFYKDMIGCCPEQLSANIRRNLERVDQVANECSKDLLLGEELVKQLDCQPTRRAYIRAVCPYVEGQLLILRVMPYLCPPLLARIPEKYGKLFAENMMDVPDRTRIKDLIKGTLYGVRAVCQLPASSKIMGERGAQQLLVAFGVRDGLMHPKSPEAMMVSDEQLESARQGVCWIAEKTVEIMPQLAAAARSVVPDSEPQ